VISTDINYTGAGSATPPAVGMCSADQVVLMVPTTAPSRWTGLPAAGAVTSLRLRGLAATGAFPGATVRPFVQTTAQPGTAVVGVPAGHTSSTPGDLPPEDPPS
jgi:hypothetical protein